MRALGFVLLVAALVGLGALLGWTERGRRTPPPPPPDSAAAPSLDSLDARTLRLRAALERLPPPLPEEENALRPPRTPRYRDHLRWADSLGVGPISSEAALDRLLARGRLVPLVDTEHYVVKTLTHSKPFVTPRLLGALGEVGRRFQERLARAGLPRYRFTVTSALRTQDLQRDLGRRNRNAAAGRSSHEYGASADIVIFRYSYVPSPSDSIRTPDAHLPRAQRLLTDAYADVGTANWDHLWGALTRVMNEMQDEGSLLVLLEAEQPVFHITTAAGQWREPTRTTDPEPPAERETPQPRESDTPAAPEPDALTPPDSGATQD